MMQPSDSERYVRISQRLALGVGASDDDSSQALAALLQRRIVDTIATECAPLLTSDLLSERVAQAMAGLAGRGIVLRVADGALIVERCFCEFDGCSHPEALLTRLLGVAIESIITQEGSTALRIVGAVDPARYTK